MTNSFAMIVDAASIDGKNESCRAQFVMMEATDVEYTHVLESILDSLIGLIDIVESSPQWPIAFKRQDFSRILDIMFQMEVYTVRFT